MKVIVGFLGIMCLVLSINGFYSCKKGHPIPPPPPVDSSQIVDLKRGLLLYLPFTGNFVDSSGNNNPTAAVSAPGLGADPSGKASSAFNGTGNGERVVVTNNGSIIFDTAYTLSVNVMLRSPQRSGFVNMIKHATGDGWVLGVGTDIGNANIVNMATVDSTGTCTTTTQPTNDQRLKSHTALKPYTWYNIITIWHKGVSHVYINGQLESSLTTINTHVPVCLSSSLTIGGWWDGDAASVNGLLDEVRLYNRAINASEIARLSQGFPSQVPLVTNLKGGLLLYLPFSGNFADSSGNGNPTTATGGPTLGTDKNGNGSSAMAADGSGARLIVTNNGSITFDTAYSVSLNVMLSSYQRSGFINMLKHATGDGWVFGLGTDVNNTNIFNFNTVDTTGDCGTTVQPSNDQLVSTPGTLQPNTWYNVITVFHNGVSKIYINGALQSTLTTNDKHVPVCLSSSLTIGGWWDGDPSGLNGKLDEVRLYNRVLTDDEIASLAGSFY